MNQLTLFSLTSFPVSGLKQGRKLISNFFLPHFLIRFSPSDKEKSYFSLFLAFSRKTTTIFLSLFQNASMKNIKAFFLLLLLSSSFAQLFIPFRLHPQRRSLFSPLMHLSIYSSRRCCRRPCTLQSVLCPCIHNF